MRLLDRYLLRELLFALAICFWAFILLWITSELVTDLHRLQENHLRAVDIVKYYLFQLPDFMQVALPVTLLLGSLYALSNHARCNEITAIRAAGVSLARLCLPYLAVGFLATVGLFLLDEFYGAKAADAADQILKSRITRKLTPQEKYLIQPFEFVNSSIGGQDRFWQAAVYNIKTSEMTGPLKVIWTPKDSPGRHSLFASSALYTNHAWHFFGDIEEYIETNDYPVKIRKTTNELAMPEFTERPRDIQSEFTINNYHDRLTSLSNRTRKADVPLSDILSYLRFHPHPDKKIRNWLYTKLHGRFAAPFTCFVAVLLAIPFAAGSGRRNVFVGVAASIFIFFAYFVLQQFGFTFGEAGWVPPWFGAWFPNMFFTLASLVMMARVR